jgi:hypothetical protein
MMSAIGPVLPSAYELDWDVISYHGSFRIFSDGEGHGEHLLRCVVWRNDQSGAIVGHNFDYTRATSHDWWTAFEAATPEECLQAVHPASRDRAARAIECFRAVAYPWLIEGTIGLHEIREAAEFSIAPEIMAMICRENLALLCNRSAHPAEFAGRPRGHDS